MKKKVALFFAVLMVMVSVTVPVNGTQSVKQFDTPEIIVSEPVLGASVFSKLPGASKFSNARLSKSVGATRGIDGLVSGSIAQGDIVAYDFTMLDANDATVKTAFSFFLTNITLGCDFDLYLVDWTIGGTILYSGVNTGSTTESFGLVFPAAYTSHDLSVLVHAIQGSGSYSLYSGPLWKERTSAGDVEVGGLYQIPTSISYQFGNIPYTSYPVYSPYFTFDLSYQNSIPDNAAIVRFEISGDGVGGNVFSLGKELSANSTGGRYYTQAGLDVLQLNGDKVTFNYNGQWNASPVGVPVKQSWTMRGFVNMSNYFTWTPWIRVDYIFPATPSNIRFL